MKAFLSILLQTGIAIELRVTDYVLNLGLLQSNYLLLVAGIMPSV